MLRTLAFAPMFALAIGLPGLAGAEQFPQSAQDVEVVGDDGRVIGRVAAVERIGDGDVVAVEIPGLEPADAPRASRSLIAEEQRELMVRVRGEDRASDETAGANGRRILR